MRRVDLYATGLTFRRKPLSGDADTIFHIVSSSGYFSSEEAVMAVELLEEYEAKGEKSGYSFVFADDMDGKTVGYGCYGPISCTQNRFNLYWIAVSETYRGQGVGKSLLQAIEQAAWAEGCQRLYVETSMRLQYTPTRRFYEKNGYLRDAVQWDYYRPGEDKIIYFKDVSKPG
ncbi:GNAT family N-acetyltransferase [Desulfovibrio inopinatus]|uniref:GNAT family N-acetyltransferase n=1 Tax=Desulfovibrio inopinatus TaxID=102109 RepID=UPI0003FA9B4F|nr:GNAT family N-acetyltransferase [Desulfovibrio inopinatus]